MRLVEIRSCSVALGRAGVKTEAAEYLRQQYTNQDGVLICQLCLDAMPFKTAGENHYFESLDGEADYMHELI